MILVTGGTGFIGSYLLRYLVAENKKVRAIRRESSPMELVAEIADRIEWVEGDMLDLYSLSDALEGIDIVYHCAAMVSFVPSDRKMMMEINAHATGDLVNLCLEKGVRKFCHVSSIAALGRNTNQREVDESSLWQDSPLNSYYAISKFKGESEVWRGIEEGLNAVIVNPAVVLGGGYWKQGTGNLFRNTAGGLRFYPIGKTGFVDVRDVARSMIHLTDGTFSNERYIINSENWYFRDVLNLIAKVAGTKPPSIKVTWFLKELAWRVESLKSKVTGSQPIVTRETALNSYYEFNYANSKISKALDFQFRPLEETIVETCQLFLKSKAEKSLFAVSPI